MPAGGHRRRRDADETLEVDDDALARRSCCPLAGVHRGLGLWWYTVQGFRRFREAYIETAKGTGKTPLGAGMMLYLLTADGERGAQVYLAAVTRDQAGLAWRDVEAMVEASPELRDLFGTDGNLARTADRRDQSFSSRSRPRSAGLDGKRVHGALIDELHEHPDAGRRQQDARGHEGPPQRADREDDQFRLRSDVGLLAPPRAYPQGARGTVANDAWFAFVCGLDPCECRARRAMVPVRRLSRLRRLGTSRARTG